MIDPEKTAFLVAWQAVRTRWNRLCEKNAKRRNNLTALKAWLDEYLAVAPKDERTEYKLVKQAIKEYEKSRNNFPYVVCFSIWLTYIKKTVRNKR